MLLTKFPGPSSTAPSRTPVLTSVLENLFPTVLTIPLSLKTLNDTSFAPESKDEDLHSGWLQIPQGSLCVVTETDIEEGQVNQKGDARFLLAYGFSDFVISFRLDEPSFPSRNDDKSDTTICLSVQRVLVSDRRIFPDNMRWT